MTVAAWIARIDRLVWGPGMLALLMGTGVFLTLRTRFLPWRNLGWALRSVLGRQARSGARGAGDVSPFSALMTTLAATIGTGNIAGVATALVAGGPGALVWMALSALLGLSSKCAECLLAVKYRRRNDRGEMCGGPMYTMRYGLGQRRLGRGPGAASPAERREAQAGAPAAPPSPPAGKRPPWRAPPRSRSRRSGRCRPR